MSQHDEDVIPDSTYAQLQPPAEFKSQIPDYLLADATLQEKYIMTELSTGAQCNRWLINALVETHAQVRRTNGRLIRAEESIKDLKEIGKTARVEWRTLAKIGGLVVGAITLAATVYSAFKGG